MTAVLAPSATGRTLVSGELFDRLAGRIVAEEKLDRHSAERVVDQSLAFLAACALNTGDPLAPSELVDIGWHTFILHTRDYAIFCDRIAGRFLHHVPTEAGDPGASGEAAHATLMRTVAAIERAGYAVDPALWPAVKGDCDVNCSQCKNGCSDDPPPAG
ncbi:glycine-rich domain-containing protein [Amycolatopsis sp. lyj-112]|uniref:glycine-rich domain-containing protein n=1 Tax=Amycolatopsis sp. lyj-112 TaxID=2789288 RepID=UPI00397B3704